jgi:DNA repair protein RadC
MKESFTVRDLPPQERPRERLAQLGAEALSAQELLAIVLGRGVKGESVTDLVQTLLKKFGNLSNMSAATLPQLQNIKGIGPAKATQLKAVFELARRLERENNTGHEHKNIIRSPQEVVGLLRNQLRGKKKEHFLLISLDRRNQIIDIQTISIGNLDSSVVHPREVFKAAISDIAASVILVHNHPSGNTEPSDEDIKLTRRLAESGSTLGIAVLDHIIIGDSSYCSMKDRGIL